jgi:integrase/recombinase XerD
MRHTLPMDRIHKRESLTSEEVTRLESACSGGEDRLVVYTLLDTGLRVNEFCHLERQNIDWQANSIVVWGKNTTGHGGKKRRVIPMTTRVKALLEHQFALYDSVEMVDRTAERIVKKIANRAGIGRKCTPHVLRHTFAKTCLVSKKISLVSLQKILGHEDLETTKIYLNMSNEEALREFEEKW